MNKILQKFVDRCIAQADRREAISWNDAKLKLGL
jgi:hypothetical protein